MTTPLPTRRRRSSLARRSHSCRSRRSALIHGKWTLPYYRALYGTAAERPKDKNDRVWFEFPKNTRIALEQTTATPSISHYTITVAPFDRAVLTKRLAELDSAVVPSPDEPDVVRFKDNYGITVELRVAD